MQRQRDLAQLIVDEFGEGTSLSLEEAILNKNMDHLAVYEVGIVGPFGPRLAKLPNYTRSYLWPEVPLGASKNGARCEDLRKLTFDDQSFDLILSAEVLEHVFELPLVLNQIRRVLKPGGVHIFSIPNAFPFPAKTVTRASIADGVITHMSAERYHVAGDGGKSLVVSDFGRDLVTLHSDAGLRLSIVRRSAPVVPFHQNATFIARRLA